MERLSALMDGELEEREVGHELASIRENPERQAAWATYHLIGEALRGEMASRSEVIGVDITEKVAARLADEPAILAPSAGVRKKARNVVTQTVLPIAASVCGVALVAWMVFSGNDAVQNLPQQAGERLLATDGSDGSSVQIAELTADEMSKTGASDVGSANDDNDAMADYLMAHQQFSPSTTMQGVVPYVRTVAVSDMAR